MTLSSAGANYFVGGGGPSSGALGGRVASSAVARQQRRRRWRLPFFGDGAAARLFPSQVRRRALQNKVPSLAPGKKDGGGDGGGGGFIGGSGAGPQAARASSYLGLNNIHR